MGVPFRLAEGGDDLLFPLVGSEEFGELLLPVLCGGRAVCEGACLVLQEEHVDATGNDVMLHGSVESDEGVAQVPLACDLALDP
ncbi:hypothetical protein [Streptomyces asiaticus]|uniref:hypothetical protein n=1 Tax=Streptomyces asiaticus TaxID=114695 RepID=UPI003F680DCE